MLTPVLALAVLNSSGKTDPTTDLRLGVPTWLDSKGQPSRDVRTVWTTVTFTLGRETAEISTITLFKNESRNGLSGKVIVPVERIGFPAEPSKISARWGDVPTQSLSGQPLSFPADLRPGDWKSFRFTATVPLARADYGGTARQISYMVYPVSQPLEQFQIAVRYTPEVFFSAISGMPSEWKWQIGERGAFIRQEKWQPETPVLVAFRYFPMPEK
ncbi:MAG: hypothetical protein MUC92_10390 [Fimbriimonadaceae bacterium]|jgi:hypothetical protein|nr:hypothetical protein [Fimbriimonadaceae bacterium]